MDKNYKELQIEYLSTKNPNIYVSQILYSYERKQFVNAYKEIVAKYKNPENDIFKLFNPYEIYLICKIGEIKSTNPLFTNLKIGDYFVNWENPKKVKIEKVENIIGEGNKVYQINSVPVKNPKSITKVIATSDYNLEGVATINRSFLRKITKEISLPKIVHVFVNSEDELNLKLETVQGIQTSNINVSLPTDFSLF